MHERVDRECGDPWGEVWGRQTDVGREGVWKSLWGGEVKRCEWWIGLMAA